MSAKKIKNTDTPSTAAAAPPRKRGRPPKAKPQAEAVNEAVSANAPIVAEDTAAPKRGRGRPRKNPEPTKQQAVEAPAKTKPARAKKPKTDEDKSPEVSSKTPQVMKLVEQRNDMVNPTIMAGKSSIPRRLRGLEPLTKIMKREAEEIFGTDQETETFNVTALVIDENAAEILRRFNACDCEICVEQLSQLTSERLPARFAKLKRRSVERNAPEVEDLKSPLRRTVTSQMIRLVIANKKRSYHD